MNRFRWVLALVGAASVTFAGVAVHEWDYKNSHRYAYGPALVIALAGCAGVALAVAVAWILIELNRERELEREQAGRERQEAYEGIRSRVGSGDFTEADYSEWFWSAGRGDVQARTRLFHLEKEVSRLANQLRDVGTAVRVDPKAAAVLDGLDEALERERPSGIPTIDPSNDEEWARFYKRRGAARQDPSD